MFAILDQTEAGKTIIRVFQEREEAFINSLERQELVRICVQHLISLPSQYYPSAVIKERMANAIVTTFPCLAYKAEGSKPYAHFYNPDLPGFIVQRLKTVRKALQPNERKKKTSSAYHTILCLPFILCQGSETNPKSFALVIEDSFISCGAKCVNDFKNLLFLFSVYKTLPLCARCSIFLSLLFLN